MVCYDLTLSGIVCCGMIWNGIVWYDIIYVITWKRMALNCKLWNGIAWYVLWTGI